MHSTPSPTATYEQAGIPSLHRTLLDRPEVLPGVETFLAGAGVGNRCDLMKGDFFAEVPPSGNAYILAVVIHDWPDDAA